MRESERENERAGEKGIEIPSKGIDSFSSCVKCQFIDIFLSCCVVQLARIFNSCKGSLLGEGEVLGGGFRGWNKGYGWCKG